jgi:hypothetical protein
MAAPHHRFKARAITVLGAAALGVSALAGTAAATVQPAAVTRCSEFSVSGGITLQVCVTGTLVDASGSANLFVNSVGAPKLRNLHTEWGGTLFENGTPLAGCGTVQVINAPGEYRCPIPAEPLPAGVSNWQVRGSTDALHKTTSGNTQVIFLNG